MQKTKTDEKKYVSFEGLLDETEESPNSLEKADETAMQTLSSPPNNELLDKIFTAAKWLLLFLPGVAVIHFSMMGLALMFFYSDFDLLVLLGSIAFGTFLMMFGLGKMKDLKYLKTVLTILGFSFLLAIIWDFLAVLIKGDFWGFYTRLTFPLIVLIGYLSKRAIDKEAEKYEFEE